jgi:hypothetical protein
MQTIRVPYSPMQPAQVGRAPKPCQECEKKQTEIDKQKVFLDDLGTYFKETRKEMNAYTLSANPSQKDLQDLVTRLQQINLGYNNKGDYLAPAPLNYRRYR